MATTEEALRLAQTLGSEDVLLAGERHAVRIPGFHLGNSPLEMTEAAVRGKTLVVTTSNGTRALLACQGAAAVYPACAANLSLAAEKAREALDTGRRPLIVCAGREGGFSLDDAYAAGRLVAAAQGDTRPRTGLNDAAHRGPRPGPPLRRRLGAPAAAEPRRPGAAAAGLRRRHRRREQDGRVSGAAPFPRASGDPRAGPGMTTDSRRRLGALTALVAGLFLGLTLLPVGMTGPVGGYIGHALWQLLGAGALGIPLLGLGLALAGFDRLGGLDMKRSALLIVGLSVLVPYVVGVLTHVRASDFDWDVGDRALSARAVGWLPGFLAVTIADKVGVAGAVLLGFLALSALTLATFAWHPLQRLERGSARTGPAGAVPPPSLEDEAEPRRRRKAPAPAPPEAVEPEPEPAEAPLGMLARAVKPKKERTKARKAEGSPVAVLEEESDLPPIECLTPPSATDVDAGESPARPAGAVAAGYAPDVQGGGQDRGPHDRAGRHPVRGRARLRGEGGQDRRPGR